MRKAGPDAVTPVIHLNRPSQSCSCFGSILIARNGSSLLRGRFFEPQNLLPLLLKTLAVLPAAGQALFCLKKRQRHAGQRALEDLLHERGVDVSHETVRF